MIAKSMNLDDIKHITIDQGTITKYGGGTAFSVNLFNDNYSDSLQINNPSFLMKTLLFFYTKQVCHLEFQKLLVNCCVIYLLLLLQKREVELLH